MDFMGYVDSAIDFAKDKIDRVMDFWDGLEDNKKKLLIGCVIASVSVILIPLEILVHLMYLFLILPLMVQITIGRLLLHIILEPTIG